MEEEGGTFCVGCGRSDGPLLGALCVKCFSERTPLAQVPEYLDLILCPTCGSRQRGNHWEKPGKENPDRVLRKDLEPFLEVADEAELEGFRWTETGENPRLREVALEASVRIEGEVILVPLETEVHLIYHSCPSCSRRGGNYFTARIQLRAAEEGHPREARPFKPWVAQLWGSHLRSLAESQREAITKEEELKEGWDVFFADTAVARTVARSFRDKVSASSKESASLWGQKNGKEIYRVTFLVRLPPVGRGDFLEDDGRLWEVASLGSKDDVVLEDVVDGRSRHVPLSELSRWRFVAGPEGRASLPVQPSSRGGPAVRTPGSSSALPLRGTLPEGGALPAALGESAPPSEVAKLPLVVGAKEAWWAPRPRSHSRRERRDSNH